MIDAHNHLQDERLDPYREDFEISPCMVNGTSEADWERVAELAEKFPDKVTPNFGLHPWFVKDRSEQWESRLNEYLDRFPNAGLGEAGIDKWVRDHDIAVQEPVFERQIQIAGERQIPLTIHCLQAFGRLKDILSRNASALPTSGFLLHSYSGPVELVDDFLELGAYFSISGYFMHERKAAAREVFRELPIDRLLVETDAPDMTLPEAQNPNLLCDDLNSPANLAAVYAFAAELREMEVGEFVEQVAGNFARFAGRSCL